MPEPDETRAHVEPPAVCGDLVPALRALRDAFGPGQVELLDVQPNPPAPAAPSRTSRQERLWQERDRKEERQR